MSELDTSGSVEGLGRATSPVYSTTPQMIPFSGRSFVLVDTAGNLTFNRSHRLVEEFTAG